MRSIGTHVRGIRAPIIKEGDDVVDIAVDSLKNSWESEGYSLKDKDVVGITESFVARAQGNYITVDDIAQKIKEKYSRSVGIIFPILSRNRFSLILKGIARSNRDIYLQLSYPDDEVGNSLLQEEKIEELGINPYTDVISEEEYYRHFGDFEHPFTGINYVGYYRNIIEKEVSSETEVKIILSNRVNTILDYTKDVLAADIHTRFKTKRKLKGQGARTVYGLDDLFTEPENKKGYNPKYGLLGSNKASEERLKLFPKNGEKVVNEIQKKLHDLTGRNVEVMIFGDGAFKDPVGKIWELADPVVSPAYTSGLDGTPNEVKLKYLADNKLNDLNDQHLLDTIKKEIKQKEDNLVGENKSQGTTPRQLTDLLGSLCDLACGSGDKGTPIILIQGYFDSLAEN